MYTRKTKNYNRQKGIYYMSEKTEVAGWAFWIFLIMMIMAVIMAAFKPMGMWWDRQVQLESHQYKEARATEQAIFKSQLIAVRHQLANPDISQGMREGLQRQEAMLMQQMSVSNIRAEQKGIITNTINQY